MSLSRKTRAGNRPLVFVLSGLLALDLQECTAPHWHRVALQRYDRGSGRELAWILGCWPISTWTAATVLTLGLYIWGGIGYQYLAGAADAPDYREFAVIRTADVDIGGCYSSVTYFVQLDHIRVSAHRCPVEIYIRLGDSGVEIRESTLIAELTPRLARLGERP